MAQKGLPIPAIEEDITVFAFCINPNIYPRWANLLASTNAVACDKDFPLTRERVELTIFFDVAILDELV